MRIPYMLKGKTEKRTTDTFGGYDRREEMGEGCFRDMLNMTARHYPAIGTRDRRGCIDVSGETIFDIKSMDIYHNGKIRKNAIVADCKNRLKAFYEEDGVFSAHELFNTSTVLSQNQKESVVSGTRLFFFPDNFQYDLMNGGVSSLSFHTEYLLGEHDDGYIYAFEFEPCDISGADSESSSPYRRLKRSCYKIKDGTAESTPSVTLAFSSSVKEGDTVRIEGLETAEANGYYSIMEISDDRRSIVVESSAVFSQTSGTVIIDREVPEMDFVVAAKNRLWGCRYGIDKYGNCVNEIYASALGDATNWKRFNGVSTDSFCASVGSAGAFTGAVTIDGNPVFFKEDAIIKVYGDYPQEFSIVESCQRGIESGSSKSAVFVHDVLYYKTYSGIVRYDGGIPMNIDAPLGGEKYRNAVAGTTDDRYFISMEDSKGNRVLFVYDTVRRLWHKEDCMNIVSLARGGGELYFLVSEDGKSLLYSAEEKKGHDVEGELFWMCESVSLGYSSPDRKYVEAVQVRLNCDERARVEAYIEYDKDGVWHHIGGIFGLQGSRLLRIRPERCDTFRLRFEGEGDARILSVTKYLKSSSPKD